LRIGALSDREEIVVVVPLPPDLVEILGAVGRVVTVEEGDAPKLKGAMATASALLVSGYVQVPAPLLAAAPSLKVISTVSVGLDHIDIDAATARNILVCNTPGVLDAAVAECAMLIILTLARRGYANMAAVRSGAWSRRDPMPPFGSDLRHKTLGILGMGRTGSAVARAASLGFGMQILYHNRSGKSPQTPFPMEYVDRADLFRRSDYVSVHVDPNAETIRSIGQAEFDLMKPSAYFVNLSRGAIVDEAALIAALLTGRIAGAALDVMEIEPPSVSNPLLGLENVVVTPHIGTATFETRRLMAELAVRNLVDVCHGTAPAAIVNPQVLAKTERLSGPAEAN
jgi:lactate dehydrogenase-like 2-hydroxyacid dehydrogenase